METYVIVRRNGWLTSDEFRQGSQGCGTRRSPSACTSRAGPWTTTCRRSFASSACAPLALQVFSSDGRTMATSNERGAMRSSLYSSCERIVGRLYAASTSSSTADGQFVGRRKVDRTIELSDGQSFSAIARVTTFDAGGNVFESGIARSTGERMSVDSIPERP
jgi:hypothetical protein